MKVSPKDFRQDIVGLRALAVMLVLLNHFKISGFGFGFIGVDIFFVISGFLITRVLYKDFVFSNLENPRYAFLSLSNFYLRRMRRILPAAFVVIIIVNVVTFYLYNSESRNNLQTDSRWALLFLANVSFLRSQSDYFQQNSQPSMLLHYWSLSIEEQFYFVWPILFLVAANLHRMKLRGLYIRFDRRILALILLVSILSFSFLQYGSAYAPKAAYFSIFTRAWELGIGSFFGILAFHKRPEVRFSSFELYSVLGISLIISAAVIDDSNWAMRVVLPVLATGFFLYAGQDNSTDQLIRSPILLPLQRIIQFVGKISYSLYLVHWPFFVIFNHFELLENTLLRLSLIPVSISGGFLLWKYIEIPFQKINLPKSFKWDKPVFEFIKTRRALIGFISFSLVGSLYLVTYPKIPQQILSDKGDISGFPNKISLQRFAEYEKELLAGTSTDSLITTKSPYTTNENNVLSLKELEDKVVLNLQNGLKLTALTNSLVNGFKFLENDASQFEKSGCASQDSEIPRDCQIGNRSANAKKVALIGDSKMGHFAQPLIDYFVAKGWLVVPYVMFGCHLSNPDNTFMKQCTNRSKWTLNKLSQTKFDLVVFAEWPTPDQREYLKSIQTNSKYLIILQTTPIITSPLRCIDSNFTYEKSCQTVSEQAVASWEKAQKLNRSLKSSNTTVIEAQNWVCIKQTCPYVSDDTFVTRDGSHLTYSYVKKLTPLIFASLDSITAW